MKEYIKTIIEKKFDSVINGYNPSHVDAFLDSIIKEIQNFDKLIKKLQDENDELKSKILELKEKNKDLEKKLIERKTNE